MDFLRTDIFLIGVLVINAILLILVILCFSIIRKINKNNKEFLRKLGNGKDIKEDLNKYMDRMLDLEEAQSQNNMYCRQLDKKVNKCIQKIGIVRYSAYKNSGNDLSFAVALLDEKNNGVVFNGLYSREMSSIYAKPIENGSSKYTITPEEGQAVLRAMGED